MKKNIIYYFNCLAFMIVIGGAVYEHLNMVPTWSAAPPASLSMFQGEYGLKPDLFWKLIHPVTIILFIINVGMNWSTDRSRSLGIVFASYVAILAITAVYFVPELISIITTPYATTSDPLLVERASLWETLSLVRLGVLVILSFVLMNGLTKSNVRVTREQWGARRAKCETGIA